MPDVVNLRAFRKRKARAEKEKRAAENRALYGLTKTEREMEKANRLRMRRMLDAHRRDDDERR
jgi:hypothetical protein